MSASASSHAPQQRAIPHPLYRSNYNRIMNGEFGQAMKAWTAQDISDGKTVVVELI
jgi:hypothetical protein